MKSKIEYLTFVDFLCQKTEVVREGSLLLESENQESPSSVSGVPSDLAYDFRHKRSSSRWNEELSPAGSTITESTQAGELISVSKMTTVSSYFSSLSSSAYNSLNTCGKLLHSISILITILF